MPKKKPPRKKTVTSDIAQDLSDAIESLYYDGERILFPDVDPAGKDFRTYHNLRKNYSQVLSQLFDISGELHDLAMDIEEREARRDR